MDIEEQQCFRFKSFLLNSAERELLRDGKGIALTPKAFDTLLVLVEKSGHLVTKEELLNTVWPDSFVDESNVSRTIHTLRRALGQDTNGEKYIETIPTKGYRFVADVENVTNRPPDLGNGTNIATNGGEVPLAGNESGLIADNGTSKGHRRHIALIALAVVLFALVTGFWMSNGVLPRPFAFARHSANGEAYRNFLEGKLLVETRTAESISQALQYFERAAEIDPLYAEAFAGVADAKTYQFNTSITHEDIASARAAVKRALELDGESAYAHTIECRILGTYDWEFEQALTECRRAVELGPNESGTHRELGLALNAAGQTGEALAELDKAVMLSPTSFNKRSRGMIAYMSRRYDEAIESLEQVDATDPGVTDAERWLLSCYLMKGEHARALEHLVKLQEANGAGPDDINAIQTAFHSTGWLAALRAAVDSPNGIGKKRSLLIAGLLAQLGEKETAFEVLHDMQKRRAIMMITVSREPLLDPLRDDPRYTALLSQINLN
jgi:DNA-binding winged helix-turn-helix (wHTH) protein